MRIGSYEVLNEIGRGGMGIVSRARTVDGKDVAIKLLAKRDPDTLARFEREKRLLAIFTASDGFVPLLDQGVAPQGPFLVMPFVTGGSLRARLERGALGLDETLTLGRALAEAVGRAHARGIVHRDLKPENVLFDAEGHALVADLGLAKHFARDSRGASQSVVLTVRGALKGTAGYMPLEQMDDAGKVGPPADVFALGAVLYECLAGVPAFSGESLLDVVTKVSEARFEPIRARRADVPAWLAAAVEACLAKDPAHRPADALAMRRLLAPPRRRLGAVLGLGAAFAAVAVTVVVFARRGDEPAAPPSPPVRKTEDPRAVARRHVIEAQARYKQLDFAGALRETTKAIEAHPFDADALALRGSARAVLNDAPGAIADCTLAIVFDPKQAEAWGTRGQARLDLGDFAGTIADCTRALELDPRTWTGWRFRGAAKLNQRDAAGAIPDLARAVEMHPTSARTWTLLATARYQADQDEQAISDCTRAIELDASMAEAWRIRGTAKGSTAHHDDVGAIEDLDRAIALEPTPQAYLARGISREHVNDLAGSIDDCSRAIDLDPGFANAWASRAYARDRAGEVAGAVADYERFLALAPDSPRSESARQRIEKLRRAR